MLGRTEQSLEKLVQKGFTASFVRLLRYFSILCCPLHFYYKESGLLMSWLEFNHFINMLLAESLVDFCFFVGGFVLKFNIVNEFTSIICWPPLKSLAKNATWLIASMPSNRREGEHSFFHLIIDFYF